MLTGTRPAGTPPPPWGVGQVDPTTPLRPRRRRTHLERPTGRAAISTLETADAVWAHRRDGFGDVDAHRARLDAEVASGAGRRASARPQDAQMPEHAQHPTERTRVPTPGPFHHDREPQHHREDRPADPHRGRVRLEQPVQPEKLDVRVEVGEPQLSVVALATSTTARTTKRPYRSHRSTPADTETTGRVQPAPQPGQRVLHRPERADPPAEGIPRHQHRQQKPKSDNEIGRMDLADEAPVVIQVQKVSTAPKGHSASTDGVPAALWVPCRTAIATMRATRANWTT